MDWDTITGISSVLIALCALGYTIWEGRKAQHHNKLSFRPHLTTWGHEDIDKGNYYVELINNGIGPALIESFVVKVDGKVIKADDMGAIEKALKIIFPDMEYKSYQEHIGKNYSMRANERRKILDIYFAESNLPSREKLKHEFSRLDLVVKYKSFYEEGFTYSSEDKKKGT